MGSIEYFEAIGNHLDDYFDDDEVIVFHEKESSDFHLDVYYIKPNKEYRDYTILLTSGVSSMPFEVPNKNSSKYIELCMLLPSDWNPDNWKAPENIWAIDILKSVGRYPSQNDTWLGFGHTIPLIKPIYNTNFTGITLLKSKSLPDDFQIIEYNEDIIDLFLLFPVYGDELHYINNNGPNDFLELFDKENIDDIIDINRKNVCEHNA